MSKINLLDSSVYNLIAAGEVVERPASVIKELVENSIDAHASLISIEITGGGILKMVVTDNGTGIEKSELEKALMPHATSKIASKDDLYSILTLGFRGEALASIASVSNLSIVSKPASQECAYEIKASAGKNVTISEAAAGNGTSVTVSDLFFNVPARAKFLKKEKSEEGEITSLVAKFILGNPTIAFRYIADGKLIYESSGLGEKDAMFCVYGKPALNETLEVSDDFGPVKIHGFIGKPSLNKPNRSYQTIIINGRVVNSYQISSTVANAFEGYLMKRQFPFFVLYINIDGSLVDVNVHPNKLEVRFSNGDLIYSSVYKAVTNALAHLDSIAEVSMFAEKQKPQTYITPDFASKIASVSSGFNNTNDIDVNEDSESAQDAKQPLTASEREAEEAAIEADREEIQRKRDEYLDAVLYTNPRATGVADGFGLGSQLLEKLVALDKEVNRREEKLKAEQTNFEIPVSITKIGKVFNTYLILQDASNIYFIDQHAAHERLNYERFKAEVESGEIAIQPLLAPYILSVNPQEKNVVEQELPRLIELGFNIYEFGDNAYKIDEIPNIVSEINFADFFNRFIGEHKTYANLKTSDLIRDELMQMACKSAVKGGNDLSENEINKLYANLGKEKVALFCPHGRPIVIRVSKEELDRWFKRIV